MLAAAGALGERFTAVHATHLTDEDARCSAPATSACARRPSATSPTASAPRGDCARPARRSPWAATRTRSSISSRRRGRWSSTSASRPACAAITPRAELLEAATAGGYGSLGWPEGGRIAAGALADLTTVALDGVRLAGTAAAGAVAATVFAAAAPDVRHVMVGGRWIVREGAHVDLDVARELAEAIRAMSTLVVDDIALLVTNDPALGEGRSASSTTPHSSSRTGASSRSSAPARAATSAWTRPGAA